MSIETKNVRSSPHTRLSGIYLSMEEVGVKELLTRFVIGWYPLEHTNHAFVWVSPPSMNRSIEGHEVWNVECNMVVGKVTIVREKAFELFTILHHVGQVFLLVIIRRDSGSGDGDG